MVLHGAQGNMLDGADQDRQALDTCVQVWTLLGQAVVFESLRSICSAVFGRIGPVFGRIGSLSAVLAPPDLVSFLQAPPAGGLDVDRLRAVRQQHLVSLLDCWHISENVSIFFCRSCCIFIFCCLASCVFVWCLFTCFLAFFCRLMMVQYADAIFAGCAGYVAACFSSSWASKSG